MGRLKDITVSVWHFYRDGFRNMTWGRPLVWLILLKVFILFAVLRVFFFKPAMSGMTEEQKTKFTPIYRKYMKDMGELWKAPKA